MTPHARGFTLIELLVVIAIISLLSSVIIASLNTARNKGYDAQRETSLREVQKALDGYYLDHGSYPPAGSSASVGSCYTAYGPGGTCSTDSQGAVGGNKSTANGMIPALVTGGYISQLPSDSQMVTATSYCCYAYIVPASGQDYKFSFYKGTAGSPCSLSAAGTGGLADPHYVGVWSVYSGNGAGL